MRLSKFIIILSILTLFLLVSVLSVSAADIDNYDNNIITDNNNINLKENIDNLNCDNDINHLQDNSDDKLRMTDESKTVDENENCLKSDSNASEGGNMQKYKWMLKM